MSDPVTRSRDARWELLRACRVVEASGLTTVRADRLRALLAERDALADEVERLTGALAGAVEWVDRRDRGNVLESEWLAQAHAALATDERGEG